MLLVASLPTLLVGCASATLLAGCASAAPATKPAAVLSAEQRALDARQQEQARRISELEARIALLEADARQTRDVTPLRSGETIRIGMARPTAPEVPVAEASAPIDTPAPRASNGRVQSLRLYGKPAAGAASNREALPPLPIVNETLPVVPLPEQRAKAQSAAQERIRDGNDGAPAEYRTALHLLQERRFDEALNGFSAFIAANPAHALVHKALYWRGEARYAQRQYAEALSEFEAVLGRFPQSDKAPDALLKMALCFRHLGAEDKAQTSFRRLRATYPNSQAASIATREGST